MANKFKRSSIEILAKLEIKTNGGNTIEIPMPTLKQSQSGVYSLRNRSNQRIYIGQTRDLHKRMLRHFNDLRMYRHNNLLLAADLQIACENEISEVEPERLFEFEVIVFCRPSELTFYENYLIKYLNPYYNIHKQKEIVVTC